MSELYHLPRSRPEDQGVSSTAIGTFLDAVETKELGLHSFMLLRRGHVIAEGWWSPYGQERPHMLYSLSKSFASTAIGLAVGEGLLTVDDHVISFFPDDLAAEPSQNLSSMRVRHLLSMSTGHAEDVTGRMHEHKEGHWVKAFLNTPVDYEPGTHFVYNSGATYMLSAIIQKLTGQNLLAYLQPRLLNPLGIEGATWETCPRGLNTGGWGLSVKTEDIAKFGQLYLQKGVWNGKRILSEAWVEEASAYQVSNGNGGESDWAQGYGYQFWRCRHDVYRGDGAFGQFCIVMPKQEAVVAITSGSNDMQGIMNQIWQHLLPVLSNESLTEDQEAQQSLESRLASLKLDPPQMQPHSSIEVEISGKRYIMEDNEENIQAVSFVFDEESSVFTLWNRQGEQQMSCGVNQWIEGDLPLEDNFSRNAASGTWRDEHTFVITCRFVETPYCDTITFYFEDDKLRMESSRNVSFGPKDRPVVYGRME